MPSAEPLDQAAATLKAKAHPRAQAAHQRLADHIEKTYGPQRFDPIDPRPALGKDDREQDRLYVEWQGIWCALREAFMGRPPRGRPTERQPKGRAA